MNTDKNPIYTLIPIEDFKTILSIDNRDEKICRFCLVTATHSIEQYCKRRLLRKRHFEMAMPEQVRQLLESYKKGL